jgi:hypothetical protein
MPSMLNEIIGRQRVQELVREGEEQRCAAGLEDGSGRRVQVLRGLLDRRRSRRRDRGQKPGRMP